MGAKIFLFSRLESATALRVEELTTRYLLLNANGKALEVGLTPPPRPKRDDAVRDQTSFTLEGGTDWCTTYTWTSLNYQAWNIHLLYKHHCYFHFP